MSSHTAHRRSAATRLAAAVLLLLVTAGCSSDAPAGPVDQGGVDSTASWPVAASIPSMRLTTTGSAAITSKDFYVTGSIAVTDTGPVAAGANLVASTEVRGHGNSTWIVFPKKPYRLRLTTAAALLGMPANRNWVLLANYADKTLLRNDVTLELSRRMGFAWTPRSRIVDLYVNEQYQGVYQLAEHVRVAPDRVNIPELKVADTSAADISGGYLLEIDETRGEPFCFDPARSPKPICVKSPDALADPAWARQRAYIVDYVARFENALYGPNFADPATGYAAFLDVASAVDYYLLQEVVKNVDSNLRRGTYLFKPRGGKLFVGPNWDFDLAIGNVNYLGADVIQGWYTRQGAWYTRMFQDPAFDARVKTRWRELRSNGTIDELSSYMARRGRLMSMAQSRNFERWPILSTYVWPNRVVTGSYVGELDAMQGWYRARVQWMDGQLGR